MYTKRKKDADKKNTHIRKMVSFTNNIIYR
jgi:hypothetical protein